MTDQNSAPNKDPGIERVVDDVDPRTVERTGDDSPAASLPRYIWRMSGRHQIGAGLIAIMVAILDLIPIELQRRIVDGALEKDSYELLLTYGALYFGVIVIHQLTKFALRLYQGWISESAIVYSRTHLFKVYRKRVEDGEVDSGNAVSILTNEIDKLGGYVGEGVTQAATNIALLIGAIVYMMIVEPTIALFGLAFMVPQILLTPFLQKRLNELVEVRVSYMRDLSGIATDEASVRDEAEEDILPKVYKNRMRFFFVKFGMKMILNFLNTLAPLTVLIYGGYLVLEDATTVGVIVAFLAGFQRVSEPLRELISFYRITAQANVQHRMISGWMHRDEGRGDG